MIISGNRLDFCWLRVGENGKNNMTFQEQRYIHYFLFVVPIVQPVRLLYVKMIVWV